MFLSLPRVSRSLSPGKRLATVSAFVSLLDVVTDAVVAQLMVILV